MRSRGGSRWSAAGSPGWPPRSGCATAPRPAPRSPCTSSPARSAASCAPVQLAGPPVEFGAESFLMRDPAGGESAAVALARRLGLGDELVHPTVGQAALVVDGGLRPMPGRHAGRRTRGSGPRWRRSPGRPRTPTATRGRPLLGAGRGRRGRRAGPAAVRRRGGGPAGRPDARRRLRRPGRRPVAGSHDAGAGPRGPGRSTPWPARSGPRRPPPPRAPGAPVFATLAGGLSTAGRGGGRRPAARRSGSGRRGARADADRRRVGG